MSKTSNKGVRSLMIIIYGRKCMLCHRKMRRKRGCITFHHIIPVSEGGETTVMNGAILCPKCHATLHRVSPDERKRMNEEIIRYKSEMEKQ